MSCKKAEEFLEQNTLDVQQRSDAKKQKKGRADALALARSVRTLVVAKGKKHVTIDMLRNVQ